jgi:hypothetical protein
MYATHHATGRQVRILNHSTSHWRNGKTLVWLNKETDVSVPWNRYEVGVVGSDTYKFLKHKIDIDIVVCLDKSDAEWLLEENYKDIRLIFASKEVLDLLGINFFKEHNVNNILCLDELHILYSYIGTQWDTSVNDACVLVALLLRFCVSFPLQPAIRETFGLSVSSELKTPPKLVFITQYYNPIQSKRRRELDICLNKNIENPFIDSIVLLNEHTYSNITSPKVTQVLINKRMYYNDVLKYIKESTYRQDTIIVFANADIYMDNSIRLLWSVNLDDVFFALLRYENGEIFGPRSDSQDTWIVNAGSIQKRNCKYEDFDFSFGAQGCDNAITTEMLRMKFKVVNPSLSIKTHHIHETNIRTYDTNAIVEKNVYLYIEPTGLHDMEAYINIDKKLISNSLNYESFERTIKCNKKSTYCKMLEKEKRYDFKPDTQNVFTKQKINIYNHNNVFQTNTGLVYDYNKIYVGTSQKSTELWSESKMSILTPSIYVSKAYVSLYEEEYKNLENYLLYYLPKILQLRNIYGKDGNFWAPNNSEFIEALSLFKWDQKDVPVLPSNEIKLVFCKETYVIYPSDINEVTKEDISILRSTLKDNNNGNDIVLFMDEEYIDGDCVKSIEKELGDVRLIFQSTSVEKKIQILQKAKLCILYCNKNTTWAWKYIWALNKNTKLFIIQNEYELNGEVHNLSCASELDHQIYVVPKGSLKPVLPKIITELKGTTTPLSNLPIIYVPNLDHKGDSFREMIDLWEERGYVTKRYTDCTNVWMNEIGDILLYDRPNYDWIKESTLAEQSWNKALFGNPKPIGNNSKSWSFWARRPRLVENMLSKEFNKTKNLVFYGKIENAVQKRNRTMYDWSRVCDEFVMANMSESPKYSEQEYLDKLSQAHYGLCLAGFGKKCHREVECMAFGTVPVCAPEVDMEYYANPPVEGLHYIRVENPNDLVKKLSNIDPTTWLRMSQACKQWYMTNCSADGLWALTKNI